MFILKISVVSNDKQYVFNATSNSIQVVSSSFTDDSLYYNNLQLTFNGTFNQLQKYIYIATIYNYFLQKYNVELVGPIDSLSGSILFGAGFDLSDSNSKEAVLSGTPNDTEIILPGHSLIWFLLDDYEVSFNEKSLQSVGPPVTPVKNLII